MINGLGVVAWGVGGIEAEAGMLGQPVYFLTPDVVGVQPHRQREAGRHRHRRGADHHRDAAQGQGRRQVRRVLRRRRRRAAGDRPRDHRQHGAGIRRDHGLLPGRRSHLPVLRRHRPNRCAGRPDPRLLPGAGPVRHPQGGRDRLLADARPRPLDRRTHGRRPQAAAGPHPAVADRTDIRHADAKAQGGRRLRQDRRRPAPHLRGRRRRRTAPRPASSSRRSPPAPTPPTPA